jgi:hypothetical protein
MLSKESILTKRTLFIFLHFLFLLIVVLVFQKSGLEKFNAGIDGLLHFDSSWYNDLRENGYLFKPDQQSNSGFYPIFSFIWRVTYLSPLGISILNALIFLSSFLLIAQHFNLNIKESLLLLSVPSLIFNYIPYTESLFFFFSTLLLIGLLKKKQWLIILSLFFCCLIRPVSIIFIPVIVFIRFVSGKKNYSHLILSITACIIPYFIVTLIQWFETDVWFAHTLAQINFWDHHFHIPKFPLTTWGGPRTIWLDGTAFWMGILSSIGCLYLFFTKNKNTLTVNTPVLFSLGYLACSTFIVLFLNGYNEKSQTTLLSLNRYFFATPYFSIAFLYFLRSPQLSNNNYIYLLISLIIIWLLFGAYTEIDWFNHLKTIIYFSLLTITIFGCVLFLNHRWFLEKRLWIFLYGGNCLLQVYLLFRFLKGDWVG